MPDTAVSATSRKILLPSWRLTMLVLFSLGLTLGALLSRADSSVTAAPAPSPLEAAAGNPPTGFIPLQPLDVHRNTSLTIVEQLRRNHFVSKPLDDAASSEIFDKYLEILDGGRYFFTSADIEALEGYRYALDDALKRGDLVPAFDIYNSFQRRHIQYLQYTLALIDAGVDKLKLDTDQQILIDRSQAPWASSDAALEQRWRQQLKARVLDMRLNDEPFERIQERLSSRYQNRLKQALQTNSEDAFQTYVNAFAATYDPHTRYLSPRASENFTINMSLSLEGIGAVLRTEDEYTEVVRLVPAGPADKAGQLRPADRIVSVGQGEGGKLIDVVGWRLDDVVELIRGPKGSVVRLEIIPAANRSETQVIHIVREAVQLEDQSAQRQLIELPHNGDVRRIGVIQIPTFYADLDAMQSGDTDYKSTTRDVARLIAELKAQGMEALIIDLRNNGGGSLQEADSLVGLFIESGPTVQVKTAHRRPSIYADTNGEVAWDGPMAVLVNRLSASASEIFAGAIQDYGRGLVIGSQTFGKGTVQSSIRLNRGRLNLTQAKFYRISGQSTQHQGVIPDIEFPEIYDVERIGESAYPDALPWDVITPAVYQRSDQFQPFLDDLRTRHQQRANNDPDFRYYQALTERMQQERERTHLSLNEALRRQEKAADDEWRRDVENARRAAKGEPLLKSVDELKAHLREEAADAETPATVLQEDAMVRESGLIMLDFLKLSRQIAAKSPVPAPVVNAAIAQ